ncbi:MAG: FAD-binding oxidoreductase [Myxococcales bacterium]|nr:FAD-binding oxidoreductase [Myxococcales bacterium]
MQVLLRILESDFDSGFLSTDPGDLEAYGRDWTRVYSPAPSAVVFPRSAEDVMRLLPLVDRFGAAVVPSGGRTGLAGGAVATNGEIVVSLDKMRRLEDVDPIARTVRVEAGAVTRSVHEHAATEDLTWPVDFASAGSSQIGGNIATNAGGLKVVRYGPTRHWVLGLEVVTLDGQLLSLNGALEKNNTGVDLRQLYIGSEGTLGIITGATLKLERLPRDVRVALFAVSGLDDALELFRSVRHRSGFDVMAFEFLTDECLQLVVARGHATSPFREASPSYVLVELEAWASWEPLDPWMEELFTSGLVTDGVLAESSQHSRALWTVREGISESLAKTGFVHKNDVALPISKLPLFVRDVEGLLAARYPEFRVFLFGHVGDGNLHINILKPDDWEVPRFLEVCHAADHALFSLVKHHRGSISAEHGIGLLKKPFLGFSREPGELELLRKLKRSLDPHNRLNPGKIFD